MIYKTVRNRVSAAFRVLGLSVLLILPANGFSQQSVSVPFLPLSEMGQSNYLGFGGGLYPGGENAMPADHLQRGLEQARSVVPRNAAGEPDGSGVIVLTSIGMSNTTQEFCTAGSTGPCESWSFTGQAEADPSVNHVNLRIVNGAAGGQSADTWISPSSPNYDRVRDRNFRTAGVTEAQVGAAWLKVADKRPSRSLPAADADAYVLEREMGDILRAMKVRYPNLQLVYISSRIYAGYASSDLNPEPYAYESGFAVKWLIEAQIRQMRTGIVDPIAGSLDSSSVAPWIGWGPYMWANGAAPRTDGLTWIPSDFESDGTHPSRTGEEKVGAAILHSLQLDPTTRNWFLASPVTSRRRPVVR